MHRGFGFIVALAFLAPLASAQHAATLNWTWSQGTGDPATGFHILRGSATGGPYSTAPVISSCETVTPITGQTAYSCSDTNVVAGSIYYYVATAFDAAGESVFSNEAKATIPLAVPNPPVLAATVK